ncbi:MAG: serine acetyltransferase [Oscillospiraceae bacterium]|nr:serine acetyltransferase [Oscillospiraceae bacterium]
MGYGSYVGVDSKIAGRPYFPHGCVGVFISNDAVIGRDAVIFQQVTIGSNTLPDSKRPGSPVIGDGVYLGAGAKVIGGITVGDCCRVGANAVVVRDLPPHSVAVCAPTQVIQKAGLDNTFRVKIGGVDYVSRNGRLVRETQPE